MIPIRTSTSEATEPNGNSHPFFGGVVQSPNLLRYIYAIQSYFGISSGELMRQQCQAPSDLRLSISPDAFPVLWKSTTCDAASTKICDIFDGGDFDGSPDNLQQHWNVSIPFAQRYGLQLFPLSDWAWEDGSISEFPQQTDSLSRACSDVQH